MGKKYISISQKYTDTSKYVNVLKNLPAYIGKENFHQHSELIVFMDFFQFVLMILES
jgi:hypothetical protein